LSVPGIAGYQEMDGKQNQKSAVQKPKNQSKPVKKKSQKTPWSKISREQKLEILKKDLKKEFRSGWIDSVFADLRFRLEPPPLAPPGKKCGYFDPCFGLLSENSISRGLAYYELNREWFDLAYDSLGVEAPEILGIFRIETNFGQKIGKQAVLNSLFWLYASSSKKKDGFERMKSFLSICAKNNWEALDILGSYAGAFGICQFMPATYILYAIDGDGDGEIDLFNDADAILSAANYLAEHGYAKSRQSKERAVHSYNPGDRKYKRAVIAYADKIREKLSN